MRRQRGIKSAIDLGALSCRELAASTPTHPVSGPEETAVKVRPGQRRTRAHLAKRPHPHRCSEGERGGRLEPTNTPRKY